jgi:hypothetical protein
LKYHVSIQTENGLVLDKREIHLYPGDEEVYIKDAYDDLLATLKLNREFDPVNPACPYCNGIWATCKCMGPWNKE